MTHDEFEAAMVFHGHKCPAMPLGYRAAQAAMRALGVERAEDKELHVIAETGKAMLRDAFWMA
jgi:formylmethanofuran dehydrogenase subunit E